VSSVFLRGGTWFLNVPTQSGTWTKRTTGTRDRSLAKAMGRMIDDMGPRGRRAWEFLTPVLAKTLTVAELFDAYSREQLDQLRERLNDVDLEPYVESWIRTVEGRLASDTREHYELYVRSLFVEGQRFAAQG
jgi:hypothetical protein